MTVATVDMQAMTDEQLCELFASDEAPAALAEAARRDRADKTAREREQIREEWRMAAHEQYLAAEAECAGNLLSRDGLANGPNDPFSLWYGREDVARKYASWELNEFWDANPRVTVTEYTAQRAAAMRAAREDTSAEEADSEGLARDERGSVRPGSETATADPVRGGQSGKPDRPVQRGGRVNIASDAATAARVAANVEARLAAARPVVERQLAGIRATVACREAQTVEVAPREPIDGNALLLDVHTALERFAVWPKEAALVTACLYAAHAHARDGKTRLPVFPYSPHLFFTAAEANGGSGKSWMARLVGKFCPDGKMMVEPNKANFVRLVESRATPIVTEMDVLVNTGGRNKWFTGLANATYEADQATFRIQNGKQIDIPMQTPLILDGLESVIKGTGTDLKTLVSRCIIIHVKVAPEGYRPPRFDKAARAVFARGSLKLGEWMGQQVNADIGEYVPDVPPWLGNRAAALWEPLFAVADAAGGEWPAWARMACADLEHGGDSWATDDSETEDEQERAYQDALASWRNGDPPAQEEEVDETEAFADA